MQTNFVYSWESLKMQDVGPGDDEVNTKDGRHTTVKLNMTKPMVKTLHVIQSICIWTREFDVWRCQAAKAYHVS